VLQSLQRVISRKERITVKLFRKSFQKKQTLKKEEKNVFIYKTKFRRLSLLFEIRSLCLSKNNEDATAKQKINHHRHRCDNSLDLYACVIKAKCMEK